MSSGIVGTLFVRDFFLAKQGWLTTVYSLEQSESEIELEHRSEIWILVKFRYLESLNSFELQ